MDPSPLLLVPDRLPIRFFSTDEVPPAQRHDFWRSQEWPSVGQLLECHPEPGFAAHSQMLVLADTTLALGQFSTQTVHRTPTLIRQAPVDHLHVTIPLDATVSTDRGMAPAGATIIIDLAREWRHHAPKGRMITIAVPRSRALEHGLDPRALHGTILPVGDTMLLREHALRILEHGATLPATAASRLSGTLVDLLAVALTGREGSIRSTEPAIDETLKRQACRLILTSLTQPWLDAEYLAGTLGISRSHLYRLFLVEGGVQRAVRRERLIAASAALAGSTATISDIAVRYRFTDTSHFSRAFRAEFGMNPSEWRTVDRDTVAMTQSKRG